MVDRSLKQSTLDKFKEIESELENLFGAAATIQQLESQFDSLYDRTERNFEKLLQEHQEEISECERQHKELNKLSIHDLEELDKQFISLKHAIDQLLAQKEHITKQIESILADFETKKNAIDTLLTQGRTEKQDLQQLNTQLEKAFAGLDDTISVRLREYQKNLDDKLKTTLDSASKTIEQVNIAHENLTQSLKVATEQFQRFIGQSEQQVQSCVERIELSVNNYKNELKTDHQAVIDNLSKSFNENTTQIKVLTQQGMNRVELYFHDFRETLTNDFNSFKNELKTNFEAAVKKAFNHTLQKLEELTNERLEKIEHKQTQFIERQTALIENNSLQIDQLRRTVDQHEETTEKNINTKQEVVDSKIENLRKELQHHNHGLFGFGKSKS